MPRHYESSAAQCPFYKGEATTLQFCEGFETVASVRLSFRNEKGAMQIKNKYCRAQWQECPLAQALLNCHKG